MFKPRLGSCPIAGLAHQACSRRAQDGMASSSPSPLLLNSNVPPATWKLPCSRQAFLQCTHHQASRPEPIVYVDGGMGRHAEFRLAVLGDITSNPSGANSEAERVQASYSSGRAACPSHRPQRSFPRSPGRWRVLRRAKRLFVGAATATVFMPSVRLCDEQDLHDFSRRAHWQYPGCELHLQRRRVTPCAPRDLIMGQPIAALRRRQEAEAP